MIYGQHGNLNKKRETMSDQNNLINNLPNLENLSPAVKFFLNETRKKLKGHERRQFMARVVSLLVS